MRNFEKGNGASPTAGEDAREPTDRRASCVHKIFGGFRIFIDGLRRRVVARGRATSRGRFRLRNTVFPPSNKA